MTAQTEGEAIHPSPPHAETVTAHAAIPLRDESTARPVQEQPAEAQPDTSASGGPIAAQVDADGPGQVDADAAAPDVAGPTVVSPDPETPEQERARLLAAVQEAEDRFLRARAELDNVQKRHRRDLDRQRSYAASETLREVLPVLDNLDMSLRAAGQGADDPQALLAGVRMIRDQLEQVLLRAGAVRIPTKGKPFDPCVHEAISVIPSEEVEREMVIEEARSGYQLKERVLRAAQVIVAKPPVAAAPASSGTEGSDEGENESATAGEDASEGEGGSADAHL